MKVTKRQLQAIKFSSPDKTKYALQALHLNGNEVRATDEHKAAFVRAPKEIDNNGAEPLLIDADQVKQIVKLIKIKKNDLLAMSTVEITKEQITLPVHLAITYGNVTMQTRIVDGKFPNVDQVIPSEDDRPIKIGLNPAYLRDICDYIAKGQLGYQPQLCIHLAKDDTANNSALITATDDDGHELRFILMQSRL